MGNYDYKLDMGQNDTSSIIIGQISNHSEVLELGPAAGRMTQYLKETMSCIIDIVELDQGSGVKAGTHARESCLGEAEGDIEKYIWYDRFKDNKYDFIIIADVLEHLRNPFLTLKKCSELLKEDGRIIISVPNLAHNVIIANLLNDEFEYKDTGLLDRTHVHFFTYHSLKKMIAETGLKIIEENAVYHGIEQTEFPIVFDKMEKEVKKAVTRHPMGNVYQFVFTLSQKGEMVRSLQIPNDYNYLCKIYYIPIGQDDFCEENSFLYHIDPSKRTFTFGLNRSVSMVRIDPINVNCIVDIRNIRLRNRDEWKKADYVTNGIFLESSGWYFSESEFQILIRDVNDFISEIECEIEFKDFEEIGISLLQNEYYEKLIQIRNMDRELHDMREQVQALQYAKHELNAIYQSRSWKMIQSLKKILGKGNGEKNG